MCSVRTASPHAQSVAAANYPLETPFHVGFFGALFSAEKSIFLFDPLLILTILLIVLLTWKHFRPA